MATYVTRVELHGVYHDHAIYNNLHQYMADQGFVRYLTTANGTHKWLPTAMYALHNVELTLTQVDGKAAIAAEKTRYGYWTLTMYVDGWQSHNLPEAK